MLRGVKEERWEVGVAFLQEAGVQTPSESRGSAGGGDRESGVPSPVIVASLTFSPREREMRERERELLLHIIAIIAIII